MRLIRAPCTRASARSGLRTHTLTSECKRKSQALAREGNCPMAVMPPRVTEAELEEDKGPSHH